MGGGVLRFVLGLLLAGPLLGTAWRAGAQLRFHGQLATELADDAPSRPLGPAPYTLPGSVSDTLASWLGMARSRLQRLAPEVRMTLPRLAVSTVFSVAVAAELGLRTLTVTTAALVCVYARCLLGGRWAARHPRGDVEEPASPVLDVSLPILVTWLIGHTTYAAIRVESVMVAACFALALGVCAQVNQTGKGLVRLLLPQAVLVALFVVARQPVTAAGVTLLASSQLLWSPLLQIPAGRARFFRALQLPLAAAMLLAAWTLR